MKRLSWLVVLALVGCKGKAPETGAGSGSAEPDPVAGSAGGGSGSGSATTGSGSAAGTGSATAGSGSGSGSAPESDDESTKAETQRREGKKTGEAVDEKPEVITEALIRKLGDGKVKLDRFLDPKRAVVHRVNMPGGGGPPTPAIDKRLCGAEAATAVATYVKHVVERERKGAAAADDPHAIRCTNEFAIVDDPTFGQNEYQEGKAVPMKQVTCISGGDGEFDEVAYLVWLPDAQRGFRIAAIVSTEHGANTGAMWNRIATELATGKPCP